MPQHDWLIRSWHQLALWVQETIFFPEYYPVFLGEYHLLAVSMKLRKLPVLPVVREAVFTLYLCLLLSLIYSLSWFISSYRSQAKIQLTHFLSLSPILSLPQGDVSN